MVFWKEWISIDQQTLPNLSSDDNYVKQKKK